MPQDCSETSNTVAHLLNDVLFEDCVTPLQHCAGSQVWARSQHGPPGSAGDRAGTGSNGIPTSHLGISVSRDGGGHGSRATGDVLWMPPSNSMEHPPEGTSCSLLQQEGGAYRCLKPVLTFEGPQEADPATSESDWWVVIRLEWVSQAYFSSRAMDMVHIHTKHEASSIREAEQHHTTLVSIPCTHQHSTPTRKIWGCQRRTCVLLFSPLPVPHGCLCVSFLLTSCCIFPLELWFSIYFGINLLLNLRSSKDDSHT